MGLENPLLIKYYIRRVLVLYRTLHDGIDRGVISDPCIICTRSTLKTKNKNWWSILESRTTSPIFNHFTSGILHGFLHLIIHDFKRAFEFVCHLEFFEASKKKVNIIFHQLYFFGNGQTYFKL